MSTCPSAEASTKARPQVDPAYLYAYLISHLTLLSSAQLSLSNDRSHSTIFVNPSRAARRRLVPAVCILSLLLAASQWVENQLSK
jgi:hypothetical protein